MGFFTWTERNPFSAFIALVAVVGTVVTLAALAAGAYIETHSPARPAFTGADAAAAGGSHG